MNREHAQGLLAVDIGSSRVKFGWFPPVGACEAEALSAQLPIAAPRLPQPAETRFLEYEQLISQKAGHELTRWLDGLGDERPKILIASVNPPGSDMLQQTLRNAMLDGQVRVLSGSELPLEVRTKHLEQTGIDRLLNAVAVNRFRRAGHLAVVVDLGTAITVDLVNADGAFEGGAILPGLSLAARALHTGTTTLPRINVERLAHIPAVVGKTTEEAITSGVYWGVVGAVEELVARIAAEHSQPLQVFLTGGDAEQMVEPLEQNPIPIRHVPHLVLSGIAIAAEELQ